MIYKTQYFDPHTGNFSEQQTTDSMEMKSAFTDDGYYVGSWKDGKYLEDKGIKPELRLPSNNCCSIGFCEREQKWYGWSHRAIYGFGIGSTCKLGDCHFSPSNKEEFLEWAKSWYEFDIKEGYYTNFKCTPVESGVRVQYTAGELSYDNIELYPEKWGRGEWTVKTLEDAKQMAMDFADDVS